MSEKGVCNKLLLQVMGISINIVLPCTSAEQMWELHKKPQDKTMKYLQKRSFDKIYYSCIYEKY